MKPITCKGGITGTDMPRVKGKSKSEVLYHDHKKCPKCQLISIGSSFNEGMISVGTVCPECGVAMEVMSCDCKESRQ